MLNKSEKDGLVLIKEHVPYHGKGIDELIVALRKIFSENKYPQKLTLEAGVRYIYLEKLVPPDDAKENETINPTSQSSHDAIRNARLEEYETREGVTPFQQLFEMFTMIQNEGLEVCHFVVGNKARFQKWLGLRIPQNNLNLFGTPITVTGEIPEDVFVVCGGPTKISDTYEITYTVKGNL